jgi:phage tail sheath protein FI
MPVFVAFTEKAEHIRQVDGETVIEDVLNRPRLITNWEQYRATFGDFADGAYLPQAVYGYFHNGGPRCYVVSVRTMARAEAALLNSQGRPQLMVRARQAGYEGLKLRVKVDVPELAASSSSSSSSKSSEKSDKEEEGAESSSGKGKSSSSSSSASSSSEPQPFTVTVERQDRNGGWQVKEMLRDVTLTQVTMESGDKQTVVAYKNNRLPQLIELIVPDSKASLSTLWPRSQEQSLNLEKQQLTSPTSQQFRGDISARTGVEGLEALDDVTMVCVPDLMSTPPGEALDLQMVKAVQTMIIGHCERLGDRVAILDTPPNLMPQEVKEWRMNITGFDSSYAAMYYPWIQVEDPVSGKPMLMPPSGHMAGVWARNDNTRGVHKAPANEVVQGATGLEYNTTKGEQDVLNPIGVNCIRAFPGRGIRVWGARTLSSDPAWRYINVRRLFNYVEKSIEGATQWVVFEPNDPKLWARVRRDVSAFLRVTWQEGALFGLSPEEAFFVKCDEENNPRESRDMGRLIIDIGLCPVMPAEFVIFRISQWAGPNAAA